MNNLKDETLATSGQEGGAPEASAAIPEDVLIILPVRNTVV
jgi:hypothetical protein